MEADSRPEAVGKSFFSNKRVTFPTPQFYSECWDDHFHFSGQGLMSVRVSSLGAIGLLLAKPTQFRFIN